MSESVIEEARDVYIMYRGGEDNIEAEKIEVQYAKLEGVKFECFKAPIEIVDEGVKYLKTEIIKDENGKEKILNLDDEEGIFTCDSIIIAIGQGPRSNVIAKTIDIDVNEVGLIKTDEYGITTREGVFASGDVVTGAKTVVEAVRVSKKVAQAIDEYVKSH
jgi:glutamate synthase (NADPH/NADH) small chain